MWGDIAIAFMLALITSYVMTPYTIRLSNKIGALDVPKEERKIHKNPIPRLGGIAVIIGFFISTIYLITTKHIDKSLQLFDEDNYFIKIIGLFISIIVLEIFCFFDDWKGIKPYTKLFGQILAAVIVVLFGIKMDKIVVLHLNTTINSEVFLTALTIIWIVAITNAINLIDGLDGLSAGIGIISCLSLIIIFSLNYSPIISIILITALAGALVGFIPFNFNPAKTFMGDTGSNFLGFCLSIISILGTAKTYTALVLIAPLFVFAIPIFDTSIAIIRRLVKEKSLKAVFKADRGHLHHKLIDKGYTQKQAVFILYGLSAMLGLFGIILLESGIYKAISFAFIVVAIIAIGYKDIFKMNNKKER